MSSSLYEIQELTSGEFVLKRGDEESPGEPLVTIRFSAESMAYLGAARFEVARAMIEAGMEAAGDLAEQSREDLIAEFDDFDHPVLH